MKKDEYTAKSQAGRNGIPAAKAYLGDQQKTYRYPGARPFSVHQSHIFFGRDDDIRNLYRLIKLEPLVVLHARSGLGKSSLLNAGILPLIEKDGEYVPVFVRFGAYRKDTGAGFPLEVTRSRIENYCQTFEPSFLDDLLSNDGSLWYLLTREHTIIRGKQKFLLVFDQFEELFTYPEPAIDAFKKQLAELLHTQIPVRFSRPVELEVESPSKLTHDQLSLLHKPMAVKIVMAIRSDRISHLDHLSSHLPLVKRNWYELDALTAQQAEEAILNPAYKKGNFASPVFDFDDGAIEEILGFLTKNHQEKIESFQLQILCQAIERKVISQGLSMVTLADLGNIQEVYENYYEDQILSLGNVEDQQAARVFIEDGLIFEEEQRRLSLYEGQIHKEYGISDDLLRRLADTHLIRREPSAKGGYLYELSHDTLVEPVLKAKAVRVAEEERKAADEERRKRDKESELKRLEFERKLKEQRKRNLSLVTLAAVLLVVAAIAIIQWNKSEMLAKEAEIQRDSADQERGKADSLRTVAVENLAEAIKQKENAEEERNKSDTLRKQADSDFKEAVMQRKLAESLSFENLIITLDLVNTNKSLKEKNDSIEVQKNIAQKTATELSKEKSKVDSLQKRTEQANQFNRSRSIALQSTQMSSIVYKDKASMALESCRVYQDSSGVFYQKYQPEIFKALYYSYASLPEFKNFNRKTIGHQIDQYIPVGNHFFTMGKVGVLELWEVKADGSFELQNVASKVSEVQNSMALSSDGRWLAVAGKSPALIIFDLQWRLSGLNSPIDLELGNLLEVYQIQFHPNAEKAFISAADQKIYQLTLNGNEWKLEGEMFETQHRVEALAVSDSYLVTGDSEGGVTVFNLKNGKKKEVEKSTGKNVTAVAIFESNELCKVAFGNEDGQIKIGVLDENGVLRMSRSEPLNQHSARIASLTFDRSGNKLAAASYDGTASVTFLEQADWPVYVFDDVGDWATSVMFLGDENSIRVSSKKGDLIDYELEMVYYEYRLKKAKGKWESKKTTMLK